MRIFERALALVLISTGLVAGSLAAPALAAGKPDSSPQAVFESALQSLRAGRYLAAIQGLESVASGESTDAFLAQFYLARIYADTSHSFADPGKAYLLFRRIADAYADIDPEEDKRSPFVAKAFVALSIYLRRGVPEVGLPADAERATQYVHHAATFFADEDAQFELAKAFLTGDGIEKDERRALHWFAVLSQRGHSGAQAFLADLHWHGRYLPKNAERAMVLATLAAESAPASERIWIESIYQQIFCGLSDGQRGQIGRVVEDWRQRYGRAPDQDKTIGAWPAPVRVCDDGRTVVLPGGDRKTEAPRPQIMATQNPSLQGPSLQAPSLQAPSLQAPSLSDMAAASAASSLVPAAPIVPASPQGPANVVDVKVRTP